VMVYVLRCPGFTGCGRPVFVMSRSADRCATTFAFALLLVRSGSGDGRATVPALTVAVLGITVLPGVPGSTLTTSVNVAEAPVARLVEVAVTVPVAPTKGVVHVHPAGHTMD